MEAACVTMTQIPPLSPKVQQFFLNKCLSIRYMPLVNFQSSEMVGLDNTV